MSAPAPGPAARRTWTWAHAAVVLLVLAAVAAKWDATTGFTALLRFGEPWHERRLDKLQPLPIAKFPESGGYDGQFYAQLAVAPLLRAPELERALDAPAYRSRRILMPWTAAVLGLGNAWWTLQVFALLNVVAWGAVAWWLLRAIADGSAVGFARWSGCVLSLGALESVRLSLVDLPALALVLWGVSAVQAGRAQRAALAWALAALTKETTLLAAAAAAWQRMRAGEGAAVRWLRTAATLVLAAAPLALWGGYVVQRFGRWSETGAAGNFDWPGLALAQQVKTWAGQLAQPGEAERAIFGLVGAIGFLVQAGSLVWRRNAESIWWRIGIAHAGLFVVLGPWVWSGYWAAARALLPLTVAFNLLLPAGRAFWPWWVLGNLSLVHGLVRFA